MLVAAGQTVAKQALHEIVILPALRPEVSSVGGRDSSVGKSSPSQAGDLGSNHDGGLTRVTQCMNERGRDYQL